MGLGVPVGMRGDFVRECVCVLGGGETSCCEAGRRQLPTARNRQYLTVFLFSLPTNREGLSAGSAVDALEAVKLLVDMYRSIQVGYLHWAHENGRSSSLQQGASQLINTNQLPRCAH